MPIYVFSIEIPCKGSHRQPSRGTAMSYLFNGVIDTIVHNRVLSLTLLYSVKLSQISVIDTAVQPTLLNIFAKSKLYSNRL
jgi:hypothetical protein